MYHFSRRIDTPGESVRKERGKEWNAELAIFISIRSPSAFRMARR